MRKNLHVSDNSKRDDLENKSNKFYKTEPARFPTTFLGKEFIHPQDEVKDWTPMKYFKLFWKDDLNELISEQTNLYSGQQNGKSLATNPGKLSK